MDADCDGGPRSSTIMANHIRSVRPQGRCASMAREAVGSKDRRYVCRSDVGQGHAGELLPGVVQSPSVGAGHPACDGLAVNSVTFGKIAFSDLRPSHVQAWVKAMQDKPIQASTIHTRFVNVRGVVRAAVKDRLLAHDVTATTRLPRQRKAAAAMSIPTPAEVGNLLREADSKFVAFVGLCAFGGLRLGEAAALRVGDVDFLKREIRVSQQVQRANGKQVEIRPPKYGSERIIYAPDELIETISEHVRIFRPGDDVDRWLFPGEGEHPLHQNSVGYLWRKARDAAGVEYRLHDLRHFYAVGIDRGWLRRGDCPAGARPWLSISNAQHVRPPMARRQRPHPAGSPRTVCTVHCVPDAYQRHKNRF